QIGFTQHAQRPLSDVFQIANGSCDDEERAVHVVILSSLSVNAKALLDCSSRAFEERQSMDQISLENRECAATTGRCDYRRDDSHHCHKPNRDSRTRFRWCSTRFEFVTTVKPLCSYRSDDAWLAQCDPPLSEHAGSRLNCG